MIRFAMKLSGEPAAVCEEDAVAVRAEAGLCDRGLHDLVNVVAYFSYVNRVVRGLGVKLGGREGPPGQ